MPNLTGLLGVVVLLLIAWSISTDRRRMPWKLILGGFLFQLIGAAVLLRFDPVVRVFDWLAAGVARVISFADAGIAFVFGEQIAAAEAPFGLVFAFKVLPIIIYFGALMAVLYHMGLMQKIVFALAWLLRRSLGVTGTEALAIAANVFVGQTEAPLCIRPFLERMTRSQLMTLMVGGFATIAGSVLAAYVELLGGDDPEQRTQWVKHLITASVLSAPAAFVMAKIIVPETGEPVDEGLVTADQSQREDNVLGAAAAGASDGLRLALNVGAMLIAFVALLALINWPLQSLGAALGIENLSIQTVLGTLFMPLAWTMGVPWGDCAAFGGLMAEKIVATEFIAYRSLTTAIHADEPAMTGRSAYIAAYALCGFANFASIGIQIGGLSALAPGRRKDFVALGLRAMIGGAMASWMTASVAGLFL